MSPPPRGATAALCAILLYLSAPSRVAPPAGKLASTAAPARASAGPVAGPSPFRWPLDGVPRPVRRFDPPPRPWLPGHRGVDLAGAVGAVVRAAGPGTVLFAGPVAGRPVVSVGHPEGLRTTYEPVRPVAVVGAPVRAGDPLGVLLAGHAGCPVPACLHWGLRRSVEYLDPLTLLGLGRVRLLPLDGAGGALSAGRAGQAGARPTVRTPRRRCRPGRTPAASRARPRR